MRRRGNINIGQQEKFAIEIKEETIIYRYRP